MNYKNPQRYKNGDRTVNNYCKFWLSRIWGNSMKKIFKQVFASLLTFVMCFMLMGYNSVFAQEQTNLNVARNDITIESFREFMKEKINHDDVNGVRAKELLIGFEKLSQEKKDKFISYVNDSDLTLKVLNALSDNNSYVTFKNGDVVVSNTQEVKVYNDVSAKRAYMQSRIATGSKSVSIFGLKVFEYSGELRYRHNGSSIRSIDHANIWISSNFLPLVNFSWDDKSTYGVGTRVAHHIEYCTWAFVHKTFGLTYGSHQIEITGSVYNRTTFTVR